MLSHNEPKPAEKIQRLTPAAAGKPSTVSPWESEGKKLEKNSKNFSYFFRSNFVDADFPDTKTWIFTENFPHFSHPL